MSCIIRLPGSTKGEFTNAFNLRITCRKRQLHMNKFVEANFEWKKHVVRFSRIFFAHSIRKGANITDACHFMRFPFASLRKRWSNGHRRHKRKVSTNQQITKPNAKRIGKYNLYGFRLFGCHFDENEKLLSTTKNLGYVLFLGGTIMLMMIQNTHSF